MWISGISAAGLNCVQLTLEEALTGLEDIAGRLSPGLAWRIGEDFRKRGVQIAVLSCYFNAVDPDKGALARHIAHFNERVRHARDFGCGIVATETGSLNADFSFNPENYSDKTFETLLRTVGALVCEAEKFGVVAAVEAVWKYPVHDPDSTMRLLNEIKSNNLQILFDPVNLANADNYHELDKLMERAFSLYGERVCVIHLKDFAVIDGKLRIVPLGRGRLNIPLLLRLANAYKPGISIILEEMDFAGIAENIEYLASCDI